jgi:hypothetical protein
MKDASWRVARPPAQRKVQPDIAISFDSKKQCQVTPPKRSKNQGLERDENFTLLVIPNAFALVRVNALSNFTDARGA